MTHLIFGRRSTRWAREGVIVPALWEAQAAAQRSEVTWPRSHMRMVASPSQEKRGRASERQVQSWRGNRVWWFLALLPPPSPPPPLDWQKGVSSDYSHRGLLHTHRTHFPEDLLWLFLFLSLGLLSKPGLYHLVGKLQGPRAHTEKTGK